MLEESLFVTAEEDDLFVEGDLAENLTLYDHVKFLAAAVVFNNQRILRYKLVLHHLAHLNDTLLVLGHGLIRLCLGSILLLLWGSLDLHFIFFFLLFLLLLLD